MHSILDPVRNVVSSRNDTIQVQVESDRLIPSVEVVDKKRILFLEFEGTKYPCLDKGWTSWTEKVLTPRGHKDREEHGLVDTETGRAKRWSISTVRKFLDMTPTHIADSVVKSWWERHDPDLWHLVKYADNGYSGAIRYIGTTRYRLYKHLDFLADLSTTDFTGMTLRHHSVTEDHMVVRVTNAEPLPIDGVDIFAGFHLLNSENGSSSIVVRHLIYDLLCANGLMMIFDKNTIVRQRHSRFDVDAFREKITDVAKTLPEIHDESKTLIIDLISNWLSREEADAALDMYEAQYEASKKFIGAVDARLPKTKMHVWKLVSALTEEAQRYGWGTRMEHEEQAAGFIRDVRDNKHLAYMKKENDGGRS